MHTLVRLASSVLALVLAACGSASRVEIEPAPLDIEAHQAARPTVDEVLADVAFTDRCAKQGDLSSEALRSIVATALDANPGVRVLRVERRYLFHSSEQEVRVTYAPHRTEERTRYYHTLFLTPRKAERRGDPAGGSVRWVAFGDEPRLTVNQEVCPSWRSFLGGLPPLEEELVDLWDVEHLLCAVQEAHVLGLIDVVRDLIPPGHRLFYISRVDERDREIYADMGQAWPDDAIVYDVHTVLGCGGRTLLVVYADGRWTAEESGEWIS